MVNYIGRNVLGIDPGMCDLLHAVNGPDKHDTTWRYTQVQRKLTLKTKKYSKIRSKKFKKVFINNRTINEWQQDPRNISKRSIDFNKFKEYLKYKNYLNINIASLYQR